MTSIFLISNNLAINNVNYTCIENTESKREKRVLSVEGEKESEALAHFSYLKGVQKIFCSPYAISIGTAKYLASKLDVQIEVNSLIGERIIGNLGDKKIRMLNELQENDFDYKLIGGESLNDVKSRMLDFIENVVKKYSKGDVAIFTHNVAIMALLSNYCDIGYNFNNRLILNYKDDAVIDVTSNDITIIELQFDGDKLVNIKRRK